MREYLILHTIALLTGILLDLLIGDPISLPHPVRAIGKLTAYLEKLLYREKKAFSQVIRGALLFVLTVMITFLAASLIVYVSYRLGKVWFVISESVLTFYCLAAKNLKDESYKVYDRIRDHDVDGARKCLSMIVGRDTDALDEAGIIRAAVETVAENASDGVIAPLLYTAVGGPVLGMCYKAVNTMDSMIGYKNTRYEYFGKVAARADDLANLVPSRISAISMIAASYILGLFTKSYDAKRSVHIWIRDRYRQKSPNSGQTESVCAGALGVRLLGDAFYNGKIVRKPHIGDDLRPVEAEDIKRAVRLMYLTEAVCTVAVLSVALILIFR